jgi:rhodanese-related sulfurtransferase
MKKYSYIGLLTISSLIFLACGIPCASVQAEELAFPSLPRITAEELRQMIDTKADVVVVDVRDSGSYEAGHIKGAVNIYYDSTGDPTDRQMTLIALPMDKLVVTYCDCTDDKSSANIAQELYKLGYDKDKVKVLRGGSLRWEQLKYPFESKK